MDANLSRFFLKGKSVKTKTMNIYQFIDRIHNILWSREAAGGIDAVKQALPIIAYVINKAREEGGKPEDVAKVVDDLLQDVRRARDERIKPFIIDLKRRVHDPAVRNFLDSIKSAIESMNIPTIEKILKVIKENKPVQVALVQDEALGALFEKMVYEAFKGGAGQYLTHRNLVIAMREIAWSQFEAEKNDPTEVLVYDPCCGSARFLTFWLEKVKHSKQIDIRSYSEHHLFGTDKFSEMVSIATVNMMVTGDGVSNIVRADATDHFGPIIDLKNMIEFLKSLIEKWESLKRRIGISQPNLVEELGSIENTVLSLGEKLVRVIDSKELKINMASDEFLSLYRFIYSLKDVDLALRELDGLESLTHRVSLPSIGYLMKTIWSEHNPKVKHGFDLVLTNPPMGRVGRGGGGGELLINDKYILAQYALSQNKWVYNLSKAELNKLAHRLGLSRKDIKPEDIAEELGREFITVEDISDYYLKLVLEDPELDWSYTIYYDYSLEPITLVDKLPIQVILLEQFLRVVKPKGKIFTVMDVGVLNNPGDEGVRRLLFLARHTPLKAIVKAVLELPHGAFTYCGAGTKVALLFYERAKELPEDYEFFVALCDFIGYDTHSKKAEPIKENDLARAICKYREKLGFEKPCEECSWENERFCIWWINEFEVI